jgi:hypothetical protein
VTVNTILRWAKAHPERKTVGSFFEPTPPVRRHADAEGGLV